MVNDLCRVTCLMAVAVTELSSQTVRTTTLGAPTAVFAEPFSRVAGVREQSDGRVVVLDGIEANIVRVDFRDGSATPIGRQGRGPGEYTLPLSLVALAGDTTLAIDMSGGGRALVITPVGAAANPLRSARFAAGTPLFMRPDIQADALGRLYEVVPRIRTEAGRQIRSDVGGLRRLDRRSGAQDTLGEISARMRSPLVRPVTSSAASDRPAAARSPGRRPPPFFSVDQWTVAPDGRIALVTVDPYRVTMIAANGKRIEGPTLSYVPVPVDQRLKDQWRERQQQPVPTLTYGPNGVAAGRSRTPYTEPDEWPAVLPPFLHRAIQFALDGTLWIERTTPFGQPQTFDLVDPNGVFSRQIILPPRTRLIGFGNGAVYTVRVDDDDLEYLQRHGLPR